MNKFLNLNALQYKQNSISFDFETKEEYQTKLNLNNQTITSCGEILARYLIDYIKKGGDIFNLTPEKVLSLKY